MRATQHQTIGGSQINLRNLACQNGRAHQLNNNDTDEGNVFDGIYGYYRTILIEDVLDVVKVNYQTRYRYEESNCICKDFETKEVEIPPRRR